MKKAQSGQPLKIPAETYNAMLDVVQSHRANMLGNRPGNVASTSPDACIFRIRNRSGLDVPQYGILGVDGLRWTSDEAMKRELLFSGNLPQHPDHSNGRFVVTFEPIRDNAIGRAVIAGIVPVRLQVDDNAHEFADVETPSNVTRLVSTPAGSAHIVWRSGTTVGEQWALVRLGRRIPFDGADAMVKQLESVGGVLREIYDFQRMHGI